jgi:hypothetical protein
MQPQLQPALLRLSAIICQYFIAVGKSQMAILHYERIAVHASNRSRQTNWIPDTLRCDFARILKETNEPLYRS